MASVGRCESCRQTAYLPDDRLCAACMRKEREAQKQAKEAERRVQRSSRGPTYTTSDFRPPPPPPPEPLPERSEQSERAERGERPERPPRPDRSERSARPERPPRPERSERPQNSERPERPERSQRPERPERPERVERPERPEREPFRLTGSPWHDAGWLRSRTSSGARHRLLAVVRSAAQHPDPKGEVTRLAQQFRGDADPSRVAAAETLEAALHAADDGWDAVIDRVQAMVAYADYRDTVGPRLPEPIADPAPGGRPSTEWMLTEARGLASRLARLDHGPVRQPLAYLQQVGASHQPWEAKQRRLALLMPLACASAARGAKTGGPRRDSLLNLVRWCAERAAREEVALEGAVIPALEAVVAYHNLAREESLLERRGRLNPAPDPPAGYLEAGYFDGSGSPHVPMLSETADAWAALLAGRRKNAPAEESVTTGQIRRFFHELKRIEELARAGAWNEVEPQLLRLVPLAADAVARGFKGGSDLRALGVLVRRNVEYLVGLLPEERQRAFMEGLLPHFEAILARFNARTKGLPARVSVQRLRGSMAKIRDEDALARAEALLRGRVSSSLLRGLYGHLLTIRDRPPASQPAEIARWIGLADDLVRRSQGAPDGCRALRELVRQAEGLDARALRGQYVPYFESIIAWYVGYEAITGGQAR